MLTIDTKVRLCHGHLSSVHPTAHDALCAALNAGLIRFRIEPVMTESRRWQSARNTCDVCDSDISHTEFVDGKTKHGPWALMCMRCWHRYGAFASFGTGQAQHYNVTGEKIDG